MQLKSTEQSRDTIKAELDRVNKMYPQCQNELTQYKSKNNELELKIRQLNRENQDYQDRYQSIDFEKLNRLELEIKRKIEVIQQSQTHIRNLENEKKNETKVRDLLNQLQEKELEIEQLHEMVQELSTTIRQLRMEHESILEQQSKQQIIIRETQNNQKLVELETRIEGLNAEIERQMMLKDQIQLKHDKLIERATEYESEINMLRNELSKTQKRLSSNNASNAYFVSKTFEVQRTGDVANNATGLVSGFNFEDSKKIKSIVNTVQHRSDVSNYSSAVKESQYSNKSPSQAQSFNPLRSDIIKQKAQYFRTEEYQNI
ncbi:unnamed protein product (macronuclear) [Paramecium tetraurelia]|uniref:Uncharacterized protein n=1 Tax=Paramecium tetraurelia TaxID=5888 RepID=A0DV69_PARTE|nr:uncharacterized protein GSPATT00020600001 [Paramecium tetraurelia]CAK86936.1 unnamed protein product [Paramecium tetraurelia]|eukprot:XP_001454333.1 hypothetical protein (macronuclear) [Paramecium tetraurelia strain d4-2]